MMPVSRNLNTFLGSLAARCPDKPLLGGPEGWKTVAEVLEAVESAAGGLMARGIRPGDLVAVRTRRSVETAVLLLALQQVGAVAVLTDPRKDPMEFLRDSGLEIPVKCAMDPNVVSLHNTNREKVDFPDADPKAPGFLIFTSGSTGKPKAVMLSQYNLVNNLVDSQPLGCYSGEDIALGALPMDHVFGLVLLAGVCVLGYSIFFPEKTEISILLTTIQREKITRMNGVPSLYLAMAQLADRYDLSSLRAGFIGGGPFTREQFRFIEEKLDMTLIPVYGMSECIGIACASWLEPQEIRADGSAPFYSMNTGKMLREDGTEAASGETGEVWVTGPARMVGYYPDVIPEERLIPTGDLGYLDENGRLHLTGRKKDIIIRNGNNLSARRIEEAILSIPGVEDAAVVALPDEMQGEVPWAMVVAWEQSGFRRKLGDRLNKNEVPVGWCFVAELPKTPSGKPDKQKIREVLMKWKA